MRVSPKRKSARRGGIFLAVFSLPLLAGGLVITGLALQGACNSVRSRNWPTVPAIVSAVDLETDDESSRVTCRYSYAFGGRPFEATRIGVMTGADNIGSWQQKTYERLRRAYESEQTVPAWVNPAAPHESFLDRRLRINLFLCVLAVGLLFTGVGGGLLAAALLSLTNRGGRQAADTDPPKELWRRRSDWSSGRIGPNIRAKAAGAWLFAVLWNLITWPTLLALKAELVRESWLGLFALVFPVIGVGLLIHATRLTLIRRKFGRSHVVLETIPGVVGGHLRGRLMLIGRTDALSDVHLELRCVRQYTTGSGEDSTEHRDILWADERSVIPALRFGQTEIALPFEFQIPHSLHETEALGKEDGVRWELHARGRCPGTDMLLIFEVPVFRTPASDEQIGEPAERRAREEAVLDSPETPLPRQIRVERTPEGYMRYRISAFPGLGFMLFFVILR